MACSKHEQQLQCGATFEGNSEIYKRIEDLKSIGNHRLMFNHECKDPEFAPRIYPCIGNSVKALRASCGRVMDAYGENHVQANAEISRIYETSLNSVKRLKALENSHQDVLNKFIFNNAMRNIVEIEGKKCGLFKEVRIFYNGSKHNNIKILKNISRYHSLISRKTVVVALVNSLENDFLGIYTLFLEINSHLKAIYKWLY